MVQETVDILYPILCPYSMLCPYDSFYSIAFLLCMLKFPIHPNYPLLPLFRQLPYSFKGSPLWLSEIRKLLLGDIRKELAKEKVREYAAKIAKEAELAGGATGKALGKEGPDGGGAESNIPM